MAKHFTIETVYEGCWRRCKEQQTNQDALPSGDRPHAIPQTDIAKKICISAAAGFISVGCPGEYRDSSESDDWSVGLRFVRVEDSYIPKLLDDLDDMVEDFVRSARD